MYSHSSKQRFIVNTKEINLFLLLNKFTTLIAVQWSSQHRVSSCSF